MPETDPVADMLRTVKAPDAIKAQIWDAFQATSNEDEFAKVLQRMPVTNTVRADLWDLKHRTSAQTPAPVAQDAPPGDPRTWGDTVSDVAIGAAKGLGNTAYGLGKIVHDYTPIGRISDAIQPGAFEPAAKPPELTPTNTPQKVGYGAEQVGEFLLPVGAAGKAAVVGKDAALALAQTGSPTQAGVTGALSAVIPGAGALKKASTSLRESALETMAGSLKATKEWAKAESEKLAPEMLKRGIGGSIKSLRKMASTAATKVGKNLDDAYKAATAAGETVPGDVIRGNIQLASDALHVMTPKGTRIPLPGHEAAITKLDELDKFIEQLGPDIPVEKAASVKRAWDEIVSKAGLYGQNKMAPASEKAAAWSYREAANSFRSMLNTNPDIAALNKEASFWIGLRDVVKATKLRRVGQMGRGGLVGQVAGGAGAAAGASIGGPAGAIGGMVIGNRLVRVLQSPAWMNKVSAPLKNELADALASGVAGRVAGVTSRIISSLPAQVRQELSAE